ncbi:MAG: DUF58 domain-containing protein [Chloroflexota bacterium]
MRWKVRGGSNAVIHVERPLIVPLVIVLGLLAIFGGVSILFVVFYAVAATVLLSYLWTRIIAGGLELSRQPSVGHLQVGSQLEERFVAVNSSILPITYLEIDDHSNFPGYPASKVESFGSRQTKTWRIEWQCRRRGRYHLGPLTIRVGDPFGFFTVQQDYDDTISFLVFPPIVDLPGVDLPRGAVAGSTSGGARALQITNTAASIRDYQPGDSYKRIHWPTTARRNQLYVKEYDLERSSDLWIILDMDRSTLLGEEEESTEEYQVRIAVALANRVLKENRAVGLIASSAEQVLIAPDKGGGQLNRILSELAAVHADGTTPLVSALGLAGPLLGRGATVAIITASGQLDWVRGALNLAQHGLTPIAFLVDPGSFGGPMQGTTVASEVLRANIHCHLVKRGHRFRLLSQEPRDASRPRIVGRGYRRDIAAKA